MVTKIKIDPITRIEGHLAIEAVVDDGVVKEAKSAGTLFRGFEIILQGRDPRDANRLTQRICGVCPTAHATASALCLDEAFGLTDKIPDNGKLIRALIFGSNFLQSHVLHFYHLAALDYVDAAGAVGDVSPFVPRYEGDYRVTGEVNAELVNHYVQALDIRRKCQEMLSIFGGKMPHNVSIVPGGVTEQLTEDKITNFLWRLNEIRDFIDNTYIPDVIAVAKVYDDYFGIGAGCKRLLSYGGFDLPAGKLFKSGVVSPDLQLEPFAKENITEDLKHSWYTDSGSGKNPAQGQTQPELKKKEAYSFLKSPRYTGNVCEVGPLARMVSNYVQGDEVTKKLVDSVLGEFNAGVDALYSVLGRHAARAVEAKIVGDAMVDWLLQLKPAEPTIVESEIPEQGEGAGLSEAPRGAVGHWITVKDKKIDRYQVISPTAWNGSPKDDKDQPGAIEQAIIGTKVKDKDNPFELVRIVRAFDPCLACAVHLLDARGNKLRVFRAV
ncbi:MAG TPA: nickel-dependent hydrogenase large subunit [Sedimentisphaerales bacterium]|nr:nickel-dependent hydrogenase large subunit [Sedimentisphaerales bacterium]